MSDDETLLDASERFRRVTDDQGRHLPWDGQRTVNFRGEGKFVCLGCAGELSLLPFEDVVHGGPQRIFYCQDCRAVVLPDVAIPKVEAAVRWMQEVLAYLKPQQVDREKLPKEVDPSIETGLVDPDGNPLGAA